MTPTYEDRTLGNGLRVLTVRKGTGPLVEVRLQIPAPAFTARRVAEQNMLAACVTARHIVSGTATATASPAAAAAEFAAGSDYRWVGMSCSTAVGGLDTALRIVSDAVSGISVTDAEYEIERAKQVTRLRMALAHPSTRAAIELVRRLFAGHPVAHVPDEAELAAVRADDVRRMPGATLRANGALLVIAGSDEPARSADLAESILDGWPAGDPAPAMPLLPSPPTGDIQVLPVPGATRAQIRLVATAVPYSDPRFAALMLAAGVLGSGTSSRLSRDLREDKGYVYGLSCHFEPVPGGMLIALEADTATATAMPAFEALATQLRVFQTSPPTPDEIDAARRRVLGAVAIGHASRAALASMLVEMSVCGVDPPSAFGIAERFRTVVPEAVGDAAGFFAPDRFSGLIAGDLPSAKPLEMEP
jgi:predicted Zn-dependent peptidase